MFSESIAVLNEENHVNRGFGRFNTALYKNRDTSVEALLTAWVVERHTYVQQFISSITQHFKILPSLDG